MKRLFNVLLVFMLSPVLTIAQADLHFSQFYETSLLRNPALAGVCNDNYRVTVYTRNQWSSVTNPYQTVLINGEYRLSLGRNSADYLSFALLGHYDQAGELDQKISSVYGAVNFNKTLGGNSSYLSFGFAGGYLQYSFDPTKATTNSQFIGGNFNPGNPTLENWPNPKMEITDFGAGINYNVSPARERDVTYMVGISAYHFLQPNFSYYKSYGYNENIRGNLNAGMIRELNEHVLWQMHANYALQGTYTEILAGGLIGWRTASGIETSEFEIYGGVFYRFQDAIIPVVKVKYKHASLGISYDVNTSSLKEASNLQGGYELTLGLTGNYPRDAGGGPKLKTICPRF